MKHGNKAKVACRKMTGAPEGSHHSNAVNSFTAYRAAVLSACESFQRREDFKAQHGAPRQLVKNGAWNVPENERPCKLAYTQHPRGVLPITSYSRHRLTLRLKAGTLEGMSIFKDDPASKPPVNFAVVDSDFDGQLTCGGAGVSQEINKFDCATPEAASRLQAHLAAIGINSSINQEWPLGNFVTGSPFAQSAKVPYLDFPRTPTEGDPSTFRRVNAAHILVDYTRYPLKFADTLMLQKYGPAQ